MTTTMMLAMRCLCICIDGGVSSVSIILCIHCRWWILPACVRLTTASKVKSTGEMRAKSVTFKMHSIQSGVFAAETSNSLACDEICFVLALSLSLHLNVIWIARCFFGKNRFATFHARWSQMNALARARLKVNSFLFPFLIHFEMTRNETEKDEENSRKLQNCCNSVSRRLTLTIK